MEPHEIRISKVISDEPLALILFFISFKYVFEETEEFWYALRAECYRCPERFFFLILVIERRCSSKLISGSNAMKGTNILAIG